LKLISNGRPQSNIKEQIEKINLIINDCLKILAKDNKKFDNLMKSLEEDERRIYGKIKFNWRKSCDLESNFFSGIKNHSSF